MRWDRGDSRLIFANPTSMKILLVDDDEALIQILTKTLIMHRHTVDVVKDGEMGWIYGSTFEYDLILLDMVLPKLNGISLCRRFRANGYVTPILLLIAQSSEAQSSKIMQVQGLDAGADDCVIKSFDLAELMARIRALQRRSHGNSFPLLAWGALFLDPRTCEVTYNSQPVFLTTKEYEFLELLLRDSQYVFSSEELIDRLWSSEAFPSEATVRSHLRRIRQKLAAVGAPPDFITTLHGRGYYLKAIETEGVTEVSFPYPRSDSVDLGSITAEATLVDCHDPVFREALSPHSQLLLISSDGRFNQSLQVAVDRWEIQLKIVPTLEPGNWENLQPNVILLRSTAQSDTSHLATANSQQPVRFLLETLETASQRYPAVPILVMSDRGDLSDRLEVMRGGGTLFLTTQTPTDQVMAAIVQVLEKQEPIKVMIVDSDRDWLSALPILLKPWSFKVTTLADPQQFWIILQAVVPDVLILEVEMPEINGFELCQMLRSDRRWQRLPVLFLSVLSDDATQQQAFTVGADDYLCKPMMEVALANRILSRLQRMRDCR